MPIVMHVAVKESTAREVMESKQAFMVHEIAMCCCMSMMSSGLGTATWRHAASLCVAGRRFLPHLVDRSFTSIFISRPLQLPNISNTCNNTESQLPRGVTRSV